MMKKKPVKKLGASNEAIMRKLAFWIRNAKPWGPQAYDKEEMDTLAWKDKTERYKTELDQWERDRDGIINALSDTMIGFDRTEFIRLMEEK